MNFEFNLEWVLIIATLYFGSVILYYFYRGYKRLPASQKEMPLQLDFAKSLFPILLLILVVRSFVAEPFRIPSGSMIPTLEIGDFIIVKKYAYGLRLPIIQTKIIDTGRPKRGDVVVFRYPPRPKINYIKRVIGLPGDTIKWSADKKLIINGKVVSYTLDGKHKTNEGTADKFRETLPNDNAHGLILFNNVTTAGDWIVPEGHYFMMGDNRDKSSDSRSWGFVPEDNLIGKASWVWMHWNGFDGGDGFQVNRIGTVVN